MPEAVGERREEMIKVHLWEDYDRNDALCGLTWHKINMAVVNEDVFELIPEKHRCKKCTLCLNKLKTKRGIK